MNQRIIAFGIVVTAAAWSLAGLGLATDRDNAFKYAEQNGLNLARAVAQNTARVFTGIDQTLIRLSGDYRKSDKDFTLAAWRRQCRFVPEQVMELAINDANGTVIFSSEPANVGQIAAGQESLAFHKAATANGSFVGRLITNSDSSVFLQVTRPIRNTAGEFVGQAIASVLPESLSQFYRSIDVGRSGFVSIVGTDGIARARSPLVASPIHAGTVENPTPAALSNHTEGCYPSVSRLDRTPHLLPQGCRPAAAGECRPCEA